MLATLVLISLATVDAGLPDVVKLVSLFDEGQDNLQEAAFHHAIEMVNEDRTILTRSRVSYSVSKLPAGDSFKASKKICELVQPGVVSVFGPISSGTASHIQSVTDALNVPHMETRWDYTTRRSPFSINLHPHPTMLSKAYADYVEKQGWNSLIILYENEEGLVRLQELIKLPNTFTGLKITIMQLEQGTMDFRPMLKAISNGPETYLVVDCDFNKVEEILKQAHEVGMVDDYHEFLFTSLDLDKITLDNYMWTGVNITGFRLADPSTPVAQYYEKKFPNVGRGKKHNLYSTNALMYYAVWFLARALNNLDSVQEIAIKPLSCEQKSKWADGEKVLSMLKDVEHVGLTGEIKFNDDGFRTELTLDLIEHHMGRMRKTGYWKENVGVNITQTSAEAGNVMQEKLQNKTLRVSTTTQDPYVMERIHPEGTTIEAKNRMSFNERYEGFCMDVIYELAKEVRFKYEFHMVPDGSYGSPKDKSNPTGAWNGMIGELRTRQADLAIVDLTITSIRQSAADFTMPFMNTGVGILYKKLKPEPPSIWSFMLPFSNEVWLYTTTTYLGVSILLFLMARLTPYEWENPHPCEEDSPQRENTLTIKNALWFGTGSFLCQGCDILPKAKSTRIIAISWWLFTLIMISSYTANLAAFLTASAMQSSIHNADDLVKQTKVKYGTYCCGSTAAFFRGSTIPTYTKINAFMESAKPSVFTKPPDANRKGLERVQKEEGGYAFFMEAAAIEYHVERKCDLTQLGGLLDSKGYGIALPPGSPYTRAMTDGVLRLQEKGKLAELKTKWWKKERMGNNKDGCPDDKPPSAKLGIMNLGGVFIVLVGGMIMACFVACCEFIWKRRRSAVDENESVFDDMWQEFKFAVSPEMLDVKPIKKEGSSKAASTQLLSSRSNASPQYGVIGEENDKSRRDSTYAVFNDNYGEHREKE